MTQFSVILGEQEVKRIRDCSSEAERYCVMHDILRPLNPEMVGFDFRQTMRDRW